MVEWANPMTYKMQDDKMTRIEQPKTRSARGSDEGMHGKRVLDALVRRERERRRLVMIAGGDLTRVSQVGM